MGLFQKINRKFEGKLIEDVALELKVGMYKLPNVEIIRIDCHQGKGGTHLCIKSKLKNGNNTFFHLCGGEAWSLADDEMGWEPGHWAYPNVQNMAAGIYGNWEHFNSPMYWSLLELRKKK